MTSLEQRGCLQAIWVVAKMGHADPVAAWHQMVVTHLLLVLSLLAVVCSHGSYCPITVSYEVSLGQAPLATPTPGAIDDFSEIPIFFGKVGIFSNNVSHAPCLVCHQHGIGTTFRSPQVLHLLLCLSFLKLQYKSLDLGSGGVQATINSWRLGWNFTARETIQSASNVYTPGVQTIALDPPSVQLQGSGINDTVKPFSWTEIAFLGTKSTTPAPNAQYKASLNA